VVPRSCSSLRHSNEFYFFSGTYPLLLISEHFVHSWMNLASVGVGQCSSSVVGTHSLDADLTFYGPYTLSHAFPKTY